MAETTAESLQQRNTTTISIIIGAVIAGVCFIALLIFLLVRRLRRKKYKLVRENSDTNSLRPLNRNTSNQSSPEDLEDLQRQRQVLIQKSLANRNSLGTNDDIRAAEQDWRSNEESSIGLKDDWKEWEARLRLERSLSLRCHPAIHHPAQELTSPLGSYLLEPGTPSRCHLGFFSFELDRRSGPTTRPASSASSWLLLVRQDARK